MKYIPVVLLFLFMHQTWAYQKVDLELSSGTEMHITRFEGEGDTLLLWLPSEHGQGPGYVQPALDLAAQDLDVWVVHFHETYMLTPGRRSLEDVELTDILELFIKARQQGFQKLFLISSSRSSGLALQAAYRWQEAHEEDSFLRGQIMFSPQLVRGQTVPGERAEYDPVAHSSNLPIYLIQAEFSPRYAHSREVAEELKRGGSPVFVHFVRGVQGGFQARPESDLSEIDLVARTRLGANLARAVKLLDATPAADLIAGALPLQSIEQSTQEIRYSNPALQPYRGKPQPPPLQLMDLGNRSYSLEQDSGSVILVNFWASWCKPCIKEIPSLVRLVDRLSDEPFKVIAVNVGEPPETIRHFLAKVPVNFNVLLDPDSETVRNWRVYAYPSNFLIDRQGWIQYAYRGALEWDAADVVETIRQLLAAPVDPH